MLRMAQINTIMVLALVEKNESKLVFAQHFGALNICLQSIDREVEYTSPYLIYLSCRRLCCKIVLIKSGIKFFSRCISKVIDK